MALPTFDANLAVLLNQSARLSFVQGEDREVLVQVQNADTQTPFDLTGCTLTFAVNRSGGGVLKRYSGAIALNFATAATLNGQSVFTLPAHGFATGDRLGLQPASGATLPAPFLADMPYAVVALSADTFALTGLDGSKRAVAAASTAQATLGTTNFGIADALLGCASLKLSSFFTAAAATGQGLPYQLNIITSDGQQRIVVGDGQLDVSVQPCP